MTSVTDARISTGARYRRLIVSLLSFRNLTVNPEPKSQITNRKSQIANRKSQMSLASGNDCYGHVLGSLKAHVVPHDPQHKCRCQRNNREPAIRPDPPAHV